MYLRYVYKLQELHLKCDNYTEAAHTLLLHADLLSWHSDPLSDSLKCTKYPSFHQHDYLKEKLYDDIIALFDKGKVSYMYIYYTRAFEERRVYYNRHKC